MKKKKKTVEVDYSTKDLIKIRRFCVKMIWNKTPNISIYSSADILELCKEMESFIITGGTSFFKSNWKDIK